MKELSLDMLFSVAYSENHVTTDLNYRIASFPSTEWIAGRNGRMVVKLSAVITDRSQSYEHSKSFFAR